MKTIVLLFVCFIPLVSGAQQFNVGIDYSFFKNSYENSGEVANYNSKGGVFLEKGFQLKFLKNIVISPGVSLKKINEKFSDGGLGAGFSSELDHYSFGGYCKIVRTFEIAKIKPAVLYLGALGGARITSWAKGSTESYSRLDSQLNGIDSDYKENPSHLFHKMHYGFLAGVVFSNSSFIEPALELRFMPTYGEYKENILSPFELAINIGFGKKNKSKRNEKLFEPEPEESTEE